MACFTGRVHPAAWLYWISTVNAHTNCMRSHIGSPGGISQISTVVPHTNCMGATVDIPVSRHGCADYACVSYTDANIGGVVGERASERVLPQIHRGYNYSV